MMPVLTPIIIHNTAAPKATDIVTGSRFAMSSVTGVDKRNEYPRQGQNSEWHQHQTHM